MNPPSLSSALSGSRIPGLDFLRALAVIFVLIDHTEYKFGGPLSIINGGIGVEIFFVLSGYLITSMLLDEWERFGSIGLKDFFQRRAARLLPVFYVYVIVGIAYLTARHKPVNWEAVLSGCLYVINYYQAFNGAPSHFLSHCWSLAVEEQFYVIWPLIFVMAFKLRWRLDLTLVALVVAVWAYRAATQLYGWHPDEYLYRSLETRADHLLIGCLLAVWLRRPSVQKRFEQLGHTPWIALTLIAALMYSGTLHRDTNYKYIYAYSIEPILIATLIPLVIMAAEKKTGPLASVLNAPWFIKTGQASYGIYLFHQLLMHPVRTAVESITGSYHLAIIVSIALVILVAHQVFIRFEAPIRQQLRPQPRRS